MAVERPYGTYSQVASPSKSVSRWRAASYVIEGALSHRDSMGNGSIIRPGDVQRMSAGSGITHSEFNASNDSVVHFLQIWLLPTNRGIAPGYEQKSFALTDNENRLRIVASPDGSDGSVKIHSDANLYLGRLRAGSSSQLTLNPDRHAWVQVVRGKARVNESELSTSDGAALSEESHVKIESIGDSEVLVFDLP